MVRIAKKILLNENITTSFFTLCNFQALGQGSRIFFILFQLKVATFQNYCHDSYSEMQSKHVSNMYPVCIPLDLDSDSDLGRGAFTNYVCT